MIDQNTIMDLRQRAEARLVSRAQRLRGSARELEIHKLELELQHEALRETNARFEIARDHYREMFLCAPHAYLVIDDRGRIVEANRAAARLTSVSIELVAGKPLASFVIPAQALELESRLAAPEKPETLLVTLATLSEPRQVRLDIRRCGHDRRLVTLTEAPRVARLESTPSDSRRLELLGSSICTVAHELNNLMQKVGSVFGRIELRTTDQSVRTLLEQGQATVRFGGDLIRRMLHVGQQHPQQMSPIVVDALLANTAELVTPILGSRIAVTLDCGASGIQVLCDPGELELALLNLTTNARDAMPDGGSLVISSRVVSSESRRWVAITFQDTGCGIAEDVQARIFEPFVSTKEVGKGTGLGLATTKEIIERGGGRIALASQVGEGTAIRLLLPVFVAPPLRLAVGTGTIVPLPRERARVLVVEDNVLSRRAMQEHLEAHGYVVYAAGRPSVALAQARAHAIDVCILDNGLPEMSGIELAEQLRALDPELRIVFASGSPQAFFEGPADAGYLEKPFALDNVVRVVESMLRGSMPSIRP